VWVFYPRRVQGKSPKWQRYYDGPFLVLEVIGDVNYRVHRSTTTDVPDAMSPLPAVATNRPRRTVLKRARFRVARETTDDKPAQAHATNPVDAEDLANEPERICSTPQAAIETSEDNIVVEAVPEIDF